MTGPGRGHWDRKTAPEQRRTLRRQRLREALTTAIAASDPGRTPTLGDVVRAAGVGRQALYDDYEDFDAAVRTVHEAVIQRLLEDLLRARAEARTPLERLRTIASSWVNLAVSEGPALTAVLTSSFVSPSHSNLREALLRAIREALAEARAAGVVAKSSDDLSLTAVLGAFEALALRLATGASSDEAQRAAQLLVELAVRVHR